MARLQPSEPSANNPVDAVRAAREGVILAMQHCGAASIESALQLLQGAVTEMLRAEEVVRSGTVQPAATLRLELTSLKRDVAALGRVADAGGAFYRGLALRLGRVSTGYAPSGTPAPQPAPQPVYEMKG